MKKLFLFLAAVSIIILSSCQVDEFLIENSTNQVLTKKISFEEFKKQTGKADFCTNLTIPVTKLNYESKTIDGKYEKSDFNIETAVILQHISRTNKTTYSLDLSSKVGVLPENQNYNLIYSKENKNWEQSIVYFETEKTVHNKINFKSFETVYSSRMVTLCYSYTNVAHCQGCTSSCDYADGCSVCYRYTITTVTECGGGGGVPADDNSNGPPGGGDFEFSPNVTVPANFVNPCQNIKDKTNTNAFMAKFNAINKNANYNLPYETGFIEKKVNGAAVYVDGLANGDKSLNISADATAYTHVHNNKPQINEDGEQYDGAVKMQSPADIIQLIVTCKNNTGTMPHDAYGIMISNEAIYSLNILDGNIDMATVNINWEKFENNYLKKCNEIIPDTSLSIAQRNEILQIMMLEGLKTLGLENKVGLFQGNVETTTNGSKTINWTRKTISPTKTLLKQPC